MQRRQSLYLWTMCSHQQVTAIKFDELYAYVWVMLGFNFLSIAHLFMVYIVIPHQIKTESKRS